MPTPSPADTHTLEWITRTGYRATFTRAQLAHASAVGPACLLPEHLDTTRDEFDLLLAAAEPAAQRLETLTDDRRIITITPPLGEPAAGLRDHLQAAAGISAGMATHTARGLLGAEAIQLRALADYLNAIADHTPCPRQP